MFHFSRLICLASFALSMSVAQAAAPDESVHCSDSNAPITIDEFVDFECPYCARGNIVMAEIRKNYPNVKIIMHQSPLSSIHPEALDAAKAYLAISILKPASAKSFADDLFAHQEQLPSGTYLLEAAARVGVGAQELQSTMTGDKVAQALDEDQKLAKQHEIRGLPSYLLGGEVIVGARPYDFFKKEIEGQTGH